MAEHIIGPVAEFPAGTHRVVRVRNLEVGVFNVGGEFYALPNICTHQFGPLCAGPVGGTTACDAATDWRFAWIREGEILTCPWHGLEFDITTGKCLANPRVRVRQYAVAVEDGVVKLRASRRNRYPVVVGSGRLVRRRHREGRGDGADGRGDRLAAGGGAGA